MMAQFFAEPLPPVLRAGLPGAGAAPAFVSPLWVTPLI